MTSAAFGSSSGTPLLFSPAELSYLHTSLSTVPPIRPDGRTATEFRSLTAETGILPATNGSAHVAFSDGSEAVVGVKVEVERTGRGSRHDIDVNMMGASEQKEGMGGRGRPEWATLTLMLPGVRDDDANLVFLEEMLREALIVQQPSSPSSLLDKLVINSRWHWHIYIDVLLISSHGLASYPLPLLSMATHLALRDTRVPRLKSEAEEDPVADDDWMASRWVYERKGKGEESWLPPVTLLVAVVGENVLFDPSREELAVADGVVAVSVADDGSGNGYRMVGMRMIDPPARDTMKGVPRSGEVPERAEIAGVWRPRVGGVKRSVLKSVIHAVLVGGVARDVIMGLDTFLTAERDAERRAAGG